MGVPRTQALPAGNTPAGDNLAGYRATCLENSDGVSDIGGGSERRHAIASSIRPAMSHLRTLVVAVWAVFTIAGPVATAPGGTARARAQAPDATGTADATAGLQALIDGTPDGGVVHLEANGNYRVEGTLRLVNRHDLRIEGNGARIFATTVGHLHRRHISIVGGSRLVVRNLEIQGANPHAGLDDRAYVEGLVGQYGVALEGATDVQLDRLNVHDVYGDFVYVSRDEDRRWTEGVWIHDSTFARSGRQGITVVAGRDVVIERNTIVDARRASIDLEPNSPSWGAENIHILDNEIGPGRLLFVAAGGLGPVNRVVIARNTLHGHILNFWVIPPEADRRQQFWVIDNTSDTPATKPPLQFTRADGVVVAGNRQPVTKLDEALVRAVDSCDVSVVRNRSQPGTLALSGEDRACGFDMSHTPPEPPAVAGRGQQEPAPTNATPTTAVPLTEPPAPTTTAPPTTPTTRAPTTTEAGSTPEPVAAADTPDDGVGAGWIVVVVAVLLLPAGAAVAISARRGRR
jgi:Right handed beta helix region